MRGKGLSIYIEARKKVLFDAGSKYYSLEYNASILGLDLSKLDYAVLSHWHRDHYAGFSALTKMQQEHNNLRASRTDKQTREARFQFQSNSYK
ncbi:MBL fold metallo-hydrolase [Hyperthermus butylicus]|uniref:MBL fold metallo-hydrolase n=1 Tax=Hyperthermus butylicus TaxID=54248 RepID=UPI000D7284DC